MTIRSLQIAIVSVGSRLVVLLVALAATLLVFRMPLGPSLHLLWSGAFGDKFAFSRAVVKATPLILTGLGMTVAWRAGAYNIGGEGQFIVGGLAAATLAKVLVPFFARPTGWLLCLLVLIASVFGGAGWAAIAGWLQIKRGVEAVISTILLNFVAVQLMSWMVEGPLQESARSLPQTDELPAFAMLFRPDQQMDLNLGTVVALIASLGVFVFLYQTKGGFWLRVTGANASISRANRIDAGLIRFKAFLLSGALCGLAGGIEYAGVAGLVGKGFSQSWGFLGIPVALVANLHPLAVVPSALYFGGLLAGSENLGRFTSGGPTLVYVIQAVAVLALVSVPRLRTRSWSAIRRVGWTS